MTRTPPRTTPRRRVAARLVGAVALVSLLASACTAHSTGRPGAASGGAASGGAVATSGAPAAHGPGTGPASSASSVPSTSAAPDSRTVWLCRPGQADDPCTADLTATSVSARGTRTVERATAAADPPIDCFYVYPTVSRQRGPNANTHVDPAETAVAIAQASRFSQVCRVFAPMYPQLTLSAIGSDGKGIGIQPALTAFFGVVSAWNDYLNNDNHGRGVVLIGHSQGALMLTALIARLIDGNPAVRRHLVSAILLGGNVAVPRHGTVGGSFAHIPACARGDQTGCVIAYSTFSSRPPADSLFGRVGSSISLPAGLGGGDPATTRVLCTDPAALDGTGGALTSYYPTSAAVADGALSRTAGIRTPWIEFPGEYSAACRSAGGLSWLQVTRTHPGDVRPALHETLGSRWGLHEVDVNIALGNLVDLVRKQAAAYRR